MAFIKANNQFDIGTKIRLSRNIESMSGTLLTMLLTDYACDTSADLDEDARIDISKCILETAIAKCKEYGIDTDKVFPYVNTNYEKHKRKTVQNGRSFLFNYG